MTNIEMIEKLIKDPNYMVLEDGNILTKITRTGKVSVKGVWRSSEWVRNDGYREISYRGRHLASHRIVYAKFIGKLIDGLTINHEDGNPKNNSKENLTQMTIGENKKHSYRVLKRSPTMGNCKINLSIANEIRKKRKVGYTYMELAKKYCLCKSSISYIVNYKTWDESTNRALQSI